MHFPQKPLKSFKKALRGSRGTSCRHGSSSGLRIPGRGLRREENMWHTDSRLLRLLAKKEGFIQTPRPAPSSTQAAGSAPGGTFRSGVAVPAVRPPPPAAVLTRPRPPPPAAARSRLPGPRAPPRGRPHAGCPGLSPQSRRPAQRAAARGTPQCPRRAG